MTFLYDGMKINYIVEGEGEDVLVLHGWGASIASVRPIIDLLKGAFRVTALDMPGCAESDEPQRAYDLPDYSALVTALCKEVGITRATVIGHSNGGLVTLKLNEEKKIEIAKNILIDSTGVRRKKSLKTKCKIAVFKISKAVFSLAGEKGRELINKNREKYASEDYKNASPVMRATMSKLLSWNLERAMENITAPTLLIWGDSDTATPLYMGKRMEALIKDSGLVVLRGGHFSYLDDRYTFSAVLKSFLKF